MLFCKNKDDDCIVWDVCVYCDDKGTMQLLSSIERTQGHPIEKMMVTW